MECPKCGYVMDAFTTDCPRCQRLGQVSQSSPEPPPPATEQPVSQPPQEHVSSAPFRRHISPAGTILIIIGIMTAVVLGGRFLLPLIPQGVSKETYDIIPDDATYEDVNRLIGFKGERTEPTNSDSPFAPSVTYQWKGKHGTIILGFDSRGKVSDRSFSGSE